jgi:NADH-quinone oxidoreductase subunit L
MIDNLAWIILLSPLAAVGLITLFTRKFPRQSALISIVAIGVSFVASLVLFLARSHSEMLVNPSINWFSVGGLDVDIGLTIDHLSMSMLLVVSGVGLMIHIYSYGYMGGDPGFSRFFACLSLFTCSMLGIVFATNFFQLFVFWELVGVSSYLLIGFWFERPPAADACKKAFITNRIGDFGFLLGIIVIWKYLGTVNFTQIQARISADPNVFGAIGGLVGLLIFFGAMGKSAQFPLHVWLPDAMEGPTPVSALIHAATMVAAGVYMLSRVFFIYGAVPHWPESLAFMEGTSPLLIIAWIGGFTALLAALIAVQQDDIKRILAYSTLSQLGYMIMAVGLAGTTPAMFHLTTHAFFKALLFLAAGSIIHAMHHQQDIWAMGRLREKMPATFWTFLIATLALAGVWPLSGFFSKDAILATALQQNPLLFSLATFVAILTSFYMFRLVFVVFFGAQKSDEAGHAHESPPVMITPLVLLAIPTVIAGFFGIDAFLEQSPGHGIAEGGGLLAGILAPFNHAPMGALAGLGAVALGFFLAYGLYWNANSDPLATKMRFLSRAMRNRFYFDEIYAGIIELTHENLARLSNGIDRWLIGGALVKGTQGATDLVGRLLRLLQTGNLQTYAFLLVIGLALLFFYFLRH